ncbi:sensor histidine kinase [bacterium]|nr:sensor histidine kinase [bacterium]
MNSEAHETRLRRLASELSRARDRERRQIARELHDNIGQSLAFMRMKLITLRGDAVFSGFDKNVNEILQMLDQTIRNTRTLCFEISPPVLHELGLTAALEWLAEHFEIKYDLKVKVVEKHPVDTGDDELNGQLFSTVRELLINVVKHAEAKQVTITLGRDSNRQYVEVKDNGVGFNPAALKSMPDKDHGLGLFNIREQLDFAGGQLECDSAPGKGARIRIVLPERRA